MTADHTPERLSAEERLKGWPYVRCTRGTQTVCTHQRCQEADRRILAAHLAALRAECDVLRKQMTRVEALRDEWRRRAADHHVEYGEPLMVNLGAYVSHLDTALRPERSYPI